MNITAQLAKHLREVYFGGNWTASNYKLHLSDLNWQQATTKVYTFNTIVTLVFHTNYYIDVVTKVFQGEPLNAKDEYSFQHPDITTEEEWQALLEKTWREAENFAVLIN